MDASELAELVEILAEVELWDDAGFRSSLPQEAATAITALVAKNGERDAIIRELLGCVTPRSHDEMQRMRVKYLPVINDDFVQSSSSG